MWTVISDEIQRDNWGSKQLLCRCVCGTERLVRISGLRNGTSKSCGCLNIKHTEGKERLYIIWKLIRQRCYNPNASGYENYGGRGIGIDPQWEDYLIFKEWALSNGYTDELTIDRLDNDKGYSPDNCAWTTKSENSIKRNKGVTGTGKTLKSRYTTKEIEQMTELRGLGWTFLAIANKFNTSISHVSRLVKGQYKYSKDFNTEEV